MGAHEEALAVYNTINLDGISHDVNHTIICVIVAISGSLPTDSQATLLYGFPRRGSSCV